MLSGDGSRDHSYDSLSDLILVEEPHPVSPVQSAGAHRPGPKSPGPDQRLVGGDSVVTAGTTLCTVSEARKQRGKSPACLWPRSLGEKVQDKPPYENVVSRGCD